MDGFSLCKIKATGLIIEFEKAGDFSVTIRPEKASETYLMYLNYMSLTPVGSEKKEGWGIN